MFIVTNGSLWETAAGWSQISPSGRMRSSWGSVTTAGTAHWYPCGPMGSHDHVWYGVIAWSLWCHSFDIEMETIRNLWNLWKPTSPTAHLAERCLLVSGAGSSKVAHWPCPGGSLKALHLDLGVNSTTQVSGRESRVKGKLLENEIRPRPVVPYLFLLQIHPSCVILIIRSYFKAVPSR